MKKYTESHEWIDGTDGRMGLSAHAVEQLGDIVFVELPQPGHRVGKGDALAVVESTKVASDIYAPASGEVVEVNATLTDNPEALAADPGLWLLRLALDDANELDALMDEAGYLASLKA